MRKGEPTKKATFFVGCCEGKKTAFHTSEKVCQEKGGRTNEFPHVELSNVIIHFHKVTFVLNENASWGFSTLPDMWLFVC